MEYAKCNMARRAVLSVTCDTMLHSLSSNLYGFSFFQMAI